MREKYCFTNDLSRFALYFSCSGRVLGTDSILGHVWYALRTHRVYCSSATKGVRWAASAIIPKPSFFLCLRLPILFELTAWAPSDDEGFFDEGSKTRCLLHCASKTFLEGAAENVLEFIYSEVSA